MLAESQDVGVVSDDFDGHDESNAGGPNDLHLGWGLHGVPDVEDEAEHFYLVGSYTEGGDGFRPLPEVNMDLVVGRIVTEH